MSARLETFHFAKVTSTHAKDAFRFHRSLALSDPHIWPRDEAYIKTLAEEGYLFGVWRGPERQLVALCYSVLDNDTWEVGGLSVHTSVQDRGIGTILTRLALGHTLAFQKPWEYGQRIVAHVHESNNDPRGLLEKLGFQHSKQIEVPASIAPPSMKRNAQGKIVGDEFEFPPDALKTLSDWFDSDPKGATKSGIRFKFDLGEVESIDNLRTALREMAQELPD